MVKENLISARLIPVPQPRIRIPKEEDKHKLGFDREKNETISLWEEKQRYPYKIDYDTTLTVVTTKRTIKITIPKGFIWNGANIPRGLWTILGISKNDPKILLASMVHDYLLWKKFECYQQFNNGNDLDFKEFRRLTTLILGLIAKKEGCNAVQQIAIEKAVAGWQWVSPQWWGFEEKYEQYLDEDYHNVGV